jgi:hypothetical protein
MTIAHKELSSIQRARHGFTKEAQAAILAGVIAFLAGAVLETGAVQNPIGNWGGDRIGLEVTEKGMRADLDCAHGTVDEPLSFDTSGRFDQKGLYVQESPGPEREGQLPQPKPARYAGRVQGSMMTLTITLLENGETIGPFSLTKDRLPRIMKCG